MERILNVGCGDDTYGTDFVDLYPARPNVIQADLEKGLPFADNTFDEVYSRCLFEHSRNPFNLLLEMRRVAKVGGKVRLITDNGSYWAFALNNGAHTGGYEKNHQPGDRHYSFFTQSHLRNHFAEAGLVVQEIRFLEYFSTTRFRKCVYATLQFLLKLTPFRNMAYARIEVVGVKQGG